MAETKTGRYINKIAACIQRNFSFSVPEDNGTKYLCGNNDAWDKLEKIVRQILEDS